GGGSDVAKAPAAVVFQQQVGAIHGREEIEIAIAVEVPEGGGVRAAAGEDRLNVRVAGQRREATGVALAQEQGRPARVVGIAAVAAGQEEIEIAVAVDVADCGAAADADEVN